MQTILSLLALAVVFFPSGASARMAPLCEAPDPWSECINNVCPDTIDLLSYTTYRGSYPTCPEAMAVRDVICISSIPHVCRWQCLPTERNEVLWHSPFLVSTFTQDLSGVGDR